MFSPAKTRKSDVLEVPPELRVRERMPVHVYRTPEDASKAVAHAIAACIRSKPNKCVLGLATGSTPTAVYEELIRLHKEEGLSFKNVITFNLDEYYPMEKQQIQSYHRYYPFLPTRIPSFPSACHPRTLTIYTKF